MFNLSYLGLANLTVNQMKLIMKLYWIAMHKYLEILHIQL